MQTVFDDGVALLGDQDAATERTPRKQAVGDRRQFLTTMPADVIKAVKQAAIEDDVNAWEIMEEAAREWLERRRKSRRKA